METRTREEREQRIRTMGEKGKFLTREAIIAKLGNGPRAVGGADSYIAHCRGDPDTFVKLNSWTGMEEFLFVVGVQDALQSRAQTMTNTQACPLVLPGATESSDPTNTNKFQGRHVSAPFQKKKGFCSLVPTTLQTPVYIYIYPDLPGLTCSRTSPGLNF